ncbi:putative F-box domain, leucine-rich repeat domain, L domain-containing protein [Medicago truncatula]|uniref:F-box/RNI superfamily protein, putative n=1 Tax=Medicago truncatula TaxID=3880 RepID=A0A072UHG9_MEDTR|nr:F-box/FBD/LRR-repeat protein At5g18770 [Medicago truncatula]XP_024638319.1 F-box/FBD/LRR-repeat protein At5g18770 [Medicago truncatula]XP_039689360.1 F-box/FBD/LRR-repeat protein At5g18770 [Medicago truncatula]KEH28841.1 F-box/RNI superfamily protein, putative [Medicago truncatula]RHN58714.1 putative F-box domain, leucine-rich repeat domain, L domain-containing protein [Medicago truncatula]
MSGSACEIMIPLSPKRIKLSESENEDRLSDLPESIILHILSFLNTNHAVQTCVLSTRYKDLWKRLPTLTLHSSDFGAYKKFTRLVSKVLFLRDSSIALQALDFKRSNGRFEPKLEKIVNYALSHNVKRLGLHFNGDIAQIPSTVFSCQALTHLKLSIYNGGRDHETPFPKSLNLPALTNLQLGDFVFDVDDNDCAEPFSIFNRLNSLLMCNCVVRGGKTLRISSVTLVNLTIYHDRSIYYEIDLCTPSLWKFVFTGTPYLSLSGSSISSLKHVDIDAEVESSQRAPLVFLLSWLVVFANIKSLTVTATTLQVLSLYPDVLKIRLPSLHNLKSLKVRMEELLYGFRMTLRDIKLQNAKSKREAARIRKAFKEGLEPPSPVPDGIVDFLCQNSPLVEVDYIKCRRRQRYL